MRKLFAMSAIALAVSLTGCSTDDDEEEVVVVENTPAVIAGDLTGSATKETTDPITGALTITDPDEGEAAVVAQTDFAGDYGTFSIAADGTWTYTLDIENTTVAGLANEEDEITETINVASVDGVVEQITFSIVGVPADQIAKITDTVEDDNGEIYYQLKESLTDEALGLTEGMISFSILYDTLETETAYISLYESEGSTSTVVGELSLNEGAYALRLNTFEEGTTPSKANKDTSATFEDAIDAPDFTPGEWVDVAMSWDTSGATGGTYSVVIDGESYGPFDSQFPIQNTLVESISIRLSSKSAIAPDAVYVNDLKIYSDAAGTTEIFSDDFEGYTVGDDLSEANDDSPYGSRTFEATVVVYGMEEEGGGEEGESGNTEVFTSTAADVTPGTTANKIVSVMDTLDSDAGELRLKLATDNRIVKGRLTASFMKTAAATCTVSESVKDAYIGVHGTPSSTYDAIVDLRIDGTDYDTDFAIRKNNVTGDKTVGIDTTFTPDTWTEVEISWDATAADSTTNPLVSISIDGTSVGDAWNSYSGAVGGLSDGAHYFTFRLGDTGAQMTDCTFSVDNIKIYASDDADVETMLFSENFEDYADGTDLSTVILEGETTLYNSATNEATVASEE